MHNCSKNGKTTRKRRWDKKEPAGPTERKKKVVNKTVKRRLAGGEGLKLGKKKLEKIRQMGAKITGIIP